VFVAQDATLPPLSGSMTFILPTTLDTYNEIMTTVSEPIRETSRHVLNVGKRA